MSERQREITGERRTFTPLYTICGPWTSLRDPSGVSSGAPVDPCVSHSVFSLTLPRLKVLRPCSTPGSNQTGSTVSPTTKSRTPEESTLRSRPADHYLHRG